MSSFPEIEPGTPLADAIRWNSEGLVPAVVQQRDSGHVLMLAWLNREALEQTIATGEGHYFSRSRDAQWRKGETSGQTQKIAEIRLDCDRDALLLVIEQTGVACHTGRRSCWFYGVRDGGVLVLHPPEVTPEELYHSED